MDPTTLYWFAGVYEGEGSCARAGKCITLTVAQKDRWLCDRIQALIGGGVGGPYGKAQHHAWWLSGQPARLLASQIIPLLSPRRQDQLVRIGIELPQAIVPGAVNGRGWVMRQPADCRIG